MRQEGKRLLASQPHHAVQRHCVETELDSLATAPYVKTDDLLRDAPHLAPWRPAAGIPPKFTDPEPVALAMMQASP